MDEIIKDDSKNQILKLKKGLNIDKKTKQPIVRNCSVFDIPSMIWSSTSFDHFYFLDTQSRQKISFVEFSKNKNNFEYLKDFQRLNDYQPFVNIYNSKTGDIFQLNKGFIHGLFDQEEEPTQNFEFLAENNDFEIDFSDPAALMRRQKKILETIHKH